MKKEVTIHLFLFLNPCPFSLSYGGSSFLHGAQVAASDHITMTEFFIPYNKAEILLCIDNLINGHINFKRSSTPHIEYQQDKNVFYV
jgi:hypothetical protein